MRAVVLAVMVVGCGGSSGGAGDASPDRDAGSRDSAPADAPGEDPFVPLVSRSWSVAAQSENRFCVGAVVTEDLWISGFRPALSPVGYRLMLTANDLPQPEGPFDCDVLADGPRLLFASGIGTGDLVFPPGAAMHVAAGQYLVLSTHVVNFDTNPAQGESSIQIRTVAADQVTDQVEAFFTGTLNDIGGIPDNGQPHPIASACVFPVDWHVIAVVPHMRRLGTGIKVARLTGSDPVTTYVDGPYTDQDVTVYPIDATIPTNDTLAVTCTYVNASGAGLARFGDSILQEECLAATYVTPAQGVGKYFCAPF